MSGRILKEIFLSLVALWMIMSVCACSPGHDGPVPDSPVENVPEEEDPEEDPDTPEVPEKPELPESDINAEDIAGTWHLVSWSGSEPGFEVYMSITEDGALTLWQRIENYGWEAFRCTLSYEDAIVSGVYQDGTAWSTSYVVTIGDESMTWTSGNDSSDVSVYCRESLPDDLSAMEFC